MRLRWLALLALIPLTGCGLIYKVDTQQGNLFDKSTVDALKPGMIPVVTVIGLSWGGLLAGAFFIEVIFAIPGLGRMSVDAIFAKDFPVMQATLIVVSINVLLVNLLVDILYGYLDPRVRVRG